ncbi:MAG: NAD-dependent epimerase/dehydratase family protein [Simkaniaceae bacterium]|nr:NAD-dependent epimerase/dehydratase family protein [Simkaniaceae bacterium]
MRVCITGISSPLAQITAQQLVDQGYSVVGFSRRARQLILPGVELHACDLKEREKISGIMAGCEIVIHIAALSSPWGSRADFEEINVQGTQHVVDAALAEGVRRLIHISTSSIYFDYRDQIGITEDQIAPRPANAYVESKRRAEAIVDGAHAQGLETITLRPRALFGPGDQVLMPRILQALEGGGMPRFRSEDVIVDVTYLENAADAIFCAVRASSSCNRQKYNITNGESVILHELCKELVTGIGYTYCERNIPYPAAYAAAWLADRLSRLSKKEPLFTPYTIGVLSFTQTLSIEKALRELKYTPCVSLKEGIARYVAWWRKR